MKDKINVAELLKDCPKGMELYSPIYGNGVLTKITNRIHVKFPKEHNVKCFRFDGKISEDGEVMLFPKGKTTWEGFVPPCKFKDGDVVATDSGMWLGIIKNKYDFEYYTVHCAIDYTFNGIFYRCGTCCFSRLATEEEKEKLFQAIKDNGYRWNSETKTLEKLIEPKFKVGDRITLKNYNDGKPIYKIIDVKDTYYVTDQGKLPFYYADSYELVPDKFDINTLVPFESRVLVRDNIDERWQPAVWGYYDANTSYPYKTIGCLSRCCIPYEGNQHLLGTTDDCDEYFKTWE